MSNQFTTQQIQDQFASLPADMQAVISSANTAELIQSIGAKHKMRIDAIGILIEYSGLMMLGLIDSDQFVNTIAREAGVVREQAANIVLDIDTQVFSQVRNSLRQAQYQSTSDTRFEAGNDFQKPKSVTPSVDDILPNESINELSNTDASLQSQAESPIDPSIPMSESDYNPNQFSTQQSESASELASDEIQPVSTTGPSALEKTADALDSAFEISPNQAGRDIEVKINTGPQTNQLADGFDSSISQQKVNKSISQSVTKDMPQAIKDAYTTGQAAAPAPTVSDELVKDFQTKLEEKLASTDTSQLNNDPYKESI